MAAEAAAVNADPTFTTDVWAKWLSLMKSRRGYLLVMAAAPSFLALLLVLLLRQQQYTLDGRSISQCLATSERPIGQMYLVAYLAVAGTT